VIPEPAPALIEAYQVSINQRGGMRLRLRTHAPHAAPKALAPAPEDRADRAGAPPNPLQELVGKTVVVTLTPIPGRDQLESFGGILRDTSGDWLVLDTPDGPMCLPREAIRMLRPARPDLLPSP
jgi:hypothetical protein